MNRSIKQAIGVDPTLLFIGAVVVSVLIYGAMPLIAIGPPKPPPRPKPKEFNPRLEFPLVDTQTNFVRVDKDGLIPIKVVAKVRNDFNDWPVFWRITVDRPFINAKREADYEQMWSGEYPNYAFIIKGGTDIDRTFSEAIQMPPGLYHVHVELATTTPLPDEDNNQAPGRALVSSSFYCRVP